MSLVNRLLRRPGLGFLSDPLDARDKPLGALLGTFLEGSPPPPSASVRNDSVRPYDQGASSSCTGQAWAQAVRTTLIHRGVNCPPLSALFAYYVSRAEWGAERKDAGSHLRTTAKAMMRFGCAADATWPMVGLRVNKQPPIAAFRSAFDLRGLRGYFRIAEGDVDGVRRAIANGNAVTAGWKIDREFQRHDGKSVLDVRRGTIIGAHAWVLEDYAADSTFGMINSWSASWGDQGRARLTAAFVAQAHDVWACAA
jgi:hypothetical protein